MPAPRDQHQEDDAGDEAASDPVLRRANFVFEVRPNTKDHAGRPVAIDKIKVGFAGIGKILDIPRLAAVDGHGHSAATGVERKIQPRWFSRQQLQERGRANVGRLGMLKHRRPDERGTDCLADHRTGAVTADEIRAVDRSPLSAIKVAG
jgi:hypothetical protein